MKSVLWACVVALCAGAHAEARWWGSPGLHRATVAAACAAGFLDFMSTARAARYGAVERNGWLADAGGRPRLGLIFGVKTGMCAVSVAVQESRLLGRGRRESADSLWSVLNSSLTSSLLAATVNNLRVANQLERPRPLPRPAAMAAGVRNGAPAHWGAGTLARGFQ